jgi:hypothetical protein
MRLIAALIEKWMEHKHKCRDMVLSPDVGKVGNHEDLAHLQQLWTRRDPSHRCLYDYHYSNKAFLLHVSPHQRLFPWHHFVFAEQIVDRFGIDNRSCSCACI